MLAMARRHTFPSHNHAVRILAVQTRPPPHPYYFETLYRRQEKPYESVRAGVEPSTMNPSVTLVKLRNELGTLCKINARSVLDRNFIRKQLFRVEKLMSTTNQNHEIMTKYY